MNKFLAMLATGLLALPSLAAGPGTLTVDDRAKAFTADGIAKAKGLMDAAEFQAPAHLVVMTGGEKDVPAAYKTAFEAARKAKDGPAGLKVVGDWASDEALKHHDKGVFVLVYTEGTAVFVKVKADRTSDAARHFDTDTDKKLADLLVKEFRAGKKDEGLYEATAFVVDKLKHTNVPAHTTAPAAGGRAGAQHNANKGGYSVGSLICFGLVAALGIWLVFGLIRSFTRPQGYGQGGGNGQGGYGGGGGGGGGGFMSGMMGGLFGAVAGNYLYNSFMGGGSSLGASGMDSGASGAGGYPDASGGDGDYAGGSEAGAGGFDDAGGDAGGGAGGFDDAGGGGGDYGGGGGDFGGGGDYGGGGGDFGGGDSGGGGGGGDW